MNTTHARYRRDAGFSVIELVVVLMLMGIVAALAQPSMSEYVNRDKTRRALDRLTGDILMARMTAVRSGDRAVLELTGPDSYLVRVEGATPATLRTVSLAGDYPGVQIQAPTADGRLVFNGRGLLLDAGSGRVIARLGARADTLEITAAGRIYRAY
jgi:type IV fimbrial biogenesis protein FimT